jgi:cytosine permease
MDTDNAEHNDDVVQQAANNDEYIDTAIPSKSRKGFWSLFVLMLAFTFFSASMSVGAQLGTNLNAHSFWLSMSIGSGILVVYTCLLAFVGSSTGLGLDALSKRAFGKFGSVIPSVLIALTQIGWFGVGLAMLAVPLAEQFDIPIYVLITLGGILMTSTAYWGVKSLTIISFVSIPLITILGLVSMFMSIHDIGGIGNIFGDNNEIGVLSGVGLVVGSFISGGTATPNFVRFAKTRAIAVWTTAIAFSLGNCLMFLFGAVSSAQSGATDIFYVMIAQGLLVPAVIVLGLNIWTTNDSGLYTAGLGLTNIARVAASINTHNNPTPNETYDPLPTNQWSNKLLSKKFWCLVGGLIGILSALWLYNNFVRWLNILSTSLPPVGAIIILDYFVNKSSYHSTNTSSNLRIFSILGIVVGILVGNFVPFFVPSINAIIASIICYMIGYIVHKTNTNNLKIHNYI